MNNLVLYARKLEADMYATANSRVSILLIVQYDFASMVQSIIVSGWLKAKSHCRACLNTQSKCERSSAS